jgi:ssDNA-binding replication factor A large subunit
LFQPVRGRQVKISDIEPGTNVSELTVRILSVAPARMITTRAGRRTMLREVLVSDDSGSVVLSLWGFGEGEDLSAGMVIRIKDGWAKEWKGNTQLSLGRSGTYEEVPDDGSVPSISELGSRTKSEPK